MNKQLNKEKSAEELICVYEGRTIALYEKGDLLRVEDKRAEDDNVEVPLCRFCSRPMKRLPKNETSKAGYTCDCRIFQLYIHQDLYVREKEKELEKHQEEIQKMETLIEQMKKIRSYIGRQSDYYKIVEDAVKKNMDTKEKTKKEKIISFETVKNNKEMVDETRTLTEKYYFYPLVL